jgi:hypothetical protein
MQRQCFVDLPLGELGKLVISAMARLRPDMEILQNAESVLVKDSDSEFEDRTRGCEDAEIDTFPGQHNACVFASVHCSLSRPASSNVNAMHRTSRKSNGQATSYTLELRRNILICVS